MTRLLAAGSGAGVAAGFNAPIAGVFFAVETVLQRQRSSRSSGSGRSGPNGLTVAMVLLSAVLAAVVAAAGLGSSPAFRVPEYRCAACVWVHAVHLGGRGAAEARAGADNDATRTNLSLLWAGIA